MEIDNNTNISNLIASSISKLNINSASAMPSRQQKKNQEENLIQENLKDDVKVLEEDKIIKNPIDVKDVQKYANMIGEDLTIEEISYGVKFGRSVIADYSA